MLSDRPMTFSLPTSSPMKASAAGQDEQPCEVKSSTTTGLPEAAAPAGVTSENAAAAPSPSAERLLRLISSIDFICGKAQSTKTHFVVSGMNGIYPIIKPLLQDFLRHRAGCRRA